LILVNREAAHLAPDADPWSTLVYAARGTDVRLTMVDGHVLVEDGKLVTMDAAELASTARDAACVLAARAGLGV